MSKDKQDINISLFWVALLQKKVLNVRSYPKFKFQFIWICDSVSLRFGVGRFGLVLEHQNEIISPELKTHLVLFLFCPKYDSVTFWNHT
jgi:hypothetical protein